MEMEMKVFIVQILEHELVLGMLTLLIQMALLN